MRGMTPCPCGQCLPCRINRRRMWKHRIMLEAAQHVHNCFVTLTYDDAHLPSDGSLRPRDMVLFNKRLRKELYPEKVRVFYVGEYGDENQRPHYHACYFGVRGCEYGGTRYWRGEVKCCGSCERIRRLWGKGRIHVGNLEADSAQYVCGYVIKKMCSKDDERLQGREPEFGRMSRRPGIGVDALWELSSQLMRYEINSNEITTLQHGKSKLPLGRFLRSKLVEMCGDALEKADGFNEEVLAVLDRVARDPEFAKTYILKEELVKAGDQQVRQLEARLKLKHRRSI